MDTKERILLDTEKTKNYDLELKIRDYVDRCVEQKLNQIKDNVIGDLLKQMEQDYRELAGYCEAKATTEALDNVVVFTNNPTEQGEIKERVNI